MTLALFCILFAAERAHAPAVEDTHGTNRWGSPGPRPPVGLTWESGLHYVFTVLYWLWVPQSVCVWGWMGGGSLQMSLPWAFSTWKSALLWKNHWHRVTSHYTAGMIPGVRYGGLIAKGECCCETDWTGYIKITTSTMLLGNIIISQYLDVFY